MTTQLALFEYASLDAETRIVVQQRTTEIKALMRRAASDIIEIGQKLIEVKLKLGHGAFGGWLAAEFDWSDQTARRFMHVAEFAKINTGVDFSGIQAKALYLLAAPSTPEAARTEAIERAEAGESITYSAARDIVSDHRSPSVPFVPTADDYADPYGDSEPEWIETAAPGSRVLVYEPPANHQLINASTNNEWYTPAPFIEAARAVMGRIDLDPASCDYANRTVQAAVFYSQEDDGLSSEWHGNVWLNPPYGRDEGESNQAVWSRRLMDEYAAGRVKQAILLVNAVPGNGWFVPLKRFPICFPDARIRFYNEETEAGQPTHSNALIYFGPNRDQFEAVFSQFGAVMGVRSVWA